MVAQANKQGVQPPYAVGSKVWSFLPREQRSKLGVKYDGPWTVTEVIGNTFKIEKEGKEDHRPQSDLKPYEQPAFSSDLTPTMSECSENKDVEDDIHKNLLWAMILTGGFANAWKRTDINPPPLSHTNQAILLDAEDEREAGAAAPAEQRDQVEVIESLKGFWISLRHLGLMNHTVVMTTNRRTVVHRVFRY